MTTEQSAVPQKKKFPWIPVAGGCCVLVLVGVAVALIVGGNIAKGLLAQARKDPKIAAEVFFAALREDASVAYTLTASDFQAATPEEDLVNYVAETPILREYTVLNLEKQDDASLDATLAIFLGTIETDTEYTTLYVETTLENDVWHVNYFELGFDDQTDEGTGAAE